MLLQGFVDLASQHAVLETEAGGLRQAVAALDAEAGGLREAAVAKDAELQRRWELLLTLLEQNTVLRGEAAVGREAAGGLEKQRAEGLEWGRRCESLRAEVGGLREAGAQKDAKIRRQLIAGLALSRRLGAREREVGELRSAGAEKDAELSRRSEHPYHFPCILYMHVIHVEYIPVCNARMNVVRYFAKRASEEGGVGCTPMTASYISSNLASQCLT